jgi:ferredoxin
LQLKKGFIMKKLYYLKNVATIELDCEKCIGCRLCEQVCPHGVFEISSKKAVIVDKDACMECGACVINCKPGALSVETGVGCASAVINSMFGIEGDCCCEKNGGC